MNRSPHRLQGLRRSWRVAGLLLTGGSSSRMGTDKAALELGGEALAVRVGGLLARVADPVIEVGPGRSGLPAVCEDPPGRGPLAALVEGVRALESRGWQGPAVVLSCDLPCLDRTALELLAYWPDAGAVVPVVAGRAQPLCARWDRHHLLEARVRFGTGARSLGDLPSGHPCTLLHDDDLGPGLARAYADADTPDELAALVGGSHRFADLHLG